MLIPAGDLCCMSYLHFLSNGAKIIPPPKTKELQLVIWLVVEAAAYLLQGQKSVDLPPESLSGKTLAHLTNLKQEEQPRF